MDLSGRPGVASLQQRLGPHGAGAPGVCASLSAKRQAAHNARQQLGSAWGASEMEQLQLLPSAYASAGAAARVQRPWPPLPQQQQAMVVQEHPYGVLVGVREAPAYFQQPGT